nr:MAG TPA: hypothetical protein [Caudoviricetes sp.]
MATYIMALERDKRYSKIIEDTWKIRSQAT